MTTFEKPQIIVHIQKGLNYTVFDCKWVPCSAKFVTMGNFARGTGVIQVYEIQRGDLKLLREVGAGSDCCLGVRACSGVCTTPCHSLAPTGPERRLQTEEYLGLKKLCHPKISLGNQYFHCQPLFPPPSVQSVVRFLGSEVEVSCLRSRTF